MLPVEIIGTAIYSDMLAKKVKKEYDALLVAGLSFEEAEELVIKAFTESFSPGHESVFWLGLACAEHRYGALSPAVRDRAVAAIDSGEDIKKWENAALYEPYYRSLPEDEDHALKILLGIAEKKYSQKPADCTEEGFKKFQEELIARLIKDYPKYKKLLPKSCRGKKAAPADAPGIKPDEFFSQINGIGDNCEKNLRARKKVLEETREYLTSEVKPVKPKKISPAKCPWKAGDIVVLKTHSAGQSVSDKNYEKMFGIRPDLNYENGKYVMLLILKVMKEPVSELIPVEVMARESVLASFYDYYGDVIPGKEEAEHIPFIIERGPFNSLHTGHRVFFEGCKRFLDKTEWIVIGSYEGFPESIPESIKNGVMGGSIMGFSDELFGFVPNKRTLGNYKQG